MYRALKGNYMVTGLYTLISVAVFLLAILPSSLYAQNQDIDIARRYQIVDPVFTYGDVVVYDRETATYRLAYKRGDADVLGVAVESPTFLLDDGTQNVPVIKSGETVVNVVGSGGPIVAGDYVTTSAVLGKAELALPEDTFLLGIALGSYAGLPEEVVGTEGGISYGQIPILLSVGHISKAQEITHEAKDDATLTEATILNIIQYLLAAFIAVGSVYIAFRNFGPNLKEGVQSIGRNPLAKSSIQSMVALNVVLIALVSIGGLLVSIAILLLPI